jgi:hypothetical protein
MADETYFDLNRPSYLNHVNSALRSDGRRERLFLAKHVKDTSILRNVVNT